MADAVKLRELIAEAQAVLQEKEEVTAARDNLKVEVDIERSARPFASVRRQ